MIRLLLAFLLVFLVSCTSQVPLVLENKGQACFYPILPNKLRVSISTEPFACLPSSCTKVLERNGNVEVNADSNVIQLFSRFVALNEAGVHLPFEEPLVCAADCGGAGFVDLEIRDLKSGIYTVKIGEDIIGTITVPFQLIHVCFDNYPQPTPFPTATLSRPTITPTSNRTPLPSPLQPLSTLPTLAP